MAKGNVNLVKVVNENSPLAWVFFAAYLGAVIYFYSIDQTFWGFILALIKAAFWPGFVVYEGLVALGAR